MAFDRHMNMVLGETEEHRKIKSKKGQGISEEKEEKRTLGLVILRGDCVVSLSIEGPPPPDDDEKLIPGGPGVGRAAGRGLPMAPMGGAPIGLAGPVRGVGGPASSMMQPPSQGEPYPQIDILSPTCYHTYIASLCQQLFADLAFCVVLQLRRRWLPALVCFPPAWLLQVCLPA
jgi:hypothetical protein